MPLLDKYLIPLIKRNSVLFKNFSFITVLQVFMLIAPLITYPYLTKVLGKSLYGVVLSAQMLASYASLIIDFGSNNVCAKHVSINRDNASVLSEIVCSVLSIRTVLWLLCTIPYCLVVILVPQYREHSVLFLVSYGLTFQELLFSQFFFQGIEEMKYITYLNIGVKSVFIALIFVFVKSAEDYLMVPVLYSAGFFIAGCLTQYIVFHTKKVRFQIPSLRAMKYYFKDCSLIFATNMICTIKEKLNYLLVGTYSGMGNVVVYDIGTKINGLLGKPTEIIETVIFPSMAQKHDKRRLRNMMLITTGICTFCVLGVNLFLPQIVEFFIHESINIIPLRLFSLAPIMLSVSTMIAYNVYVAWGYNKYMLYSILITTAAYIVALLVMLVTNRMGSLYSFIILSLVSYAAELIYRVISGLKIIRNESDISE